MHQQQPPQQQQQQPHYPQQQQHPTSSRGSYSPMDLDQQQPRCPALRAGSERNQLPGLQGHAHGGYAPRYDHFNGQAPVAWWPPPGYDRWQYNHSGMPYHYHPPPFATPPGLELPPSPPGNVLAGPFHSHRPGANQYNAHENAVMYTHTHPHTHTQAPAQAHPNFSHRPTIPSINRMGDTMSMPVHPFAYPRNADSNDFGHANRLPAISQISPNFSEETDLAGGRPAPQPDAESTRAPTRGQERQTSSTSSNNTVSMPPMRQRTTELGGERPHIVIGSGYLGGEHFPDEMSSDDEFDQNDTAMITTALLNNLTAASGQESGLRAAQIMRGAPTGRRVASRQAIASLESVKIEDIQEGERNCIICYNDFGTETPEGINEAPLRLPKCRHIFGDHCIKKWLAESNSCPYCRDKLPSEQQHVLRHETLVQLSRRELSRQVETHATGWPPVDRRSPPNDNGEFRRRMRPRYGSSRGSPPSRARGFAHPALPSGHFSYQNGNRFNPSSPERRYFMGSGSTTSATARHNQESTMPRAVNSPFVTMPTTLPIPIRNPLVDPEIRAGWVPQTNFLPYVRHGGATDVADVEMAQSDPTGSSNRTESTIDR